MENKKDVVIAAKTPIKVDLEAGKEYCYCTCGLSGGQPFCDNSHFGTTHDGGMTFTAEKSGPAFSAAASTPATPPTATGPTPSSDPVPHAKRRPRVFRAPLCVPGGANPAPIREIGFPPLSSRIQSADW